MNKKILVTGANGFLGKNLQNHLTNNENSVYFFIGRDYADLSKTEDVKRIFKTFNPTHIIHTAAMASARGSDTSFIDNNIKATYNLLEHCPNHTDFIFTSSVLVYGDNPSCMFECDRIKPNSPYAISKSCCENLIDYYSRKGKVRPRILRFCGIVGPHMRHGRIHSIINGERQIKMFGKAPGNSCPLITIEDATKTIKACLEYNKPYLLCNVSPQNDTISIQSIIEILGQELSTKINLDWQNDGSNNEYICCYNERLNYELGIDIENTSEKALIKGLQLIRDYHDKQNRSLVTS